MATLGLRCCARAFSSCGERGLLFIAVRGLLIVVTSLVAQHELQARGLSSCGSQALELRLSSCGAQLSCSAACAILPRPRLEPVSPALAGGFLTTAPPGKPHVVRFGPKQTGFRVYTLNHQSVGNNFSFVATVTSYNFL